MALLVAMAAGAALHGQDTPKGSISVRTAVALKSAVGPELLRVSYDYSVPVETVVHIDGFGDVPPSGSLSYVTASRTIRIRRLDGALLAAVEIAGAQVAMGAPGAELETAFVGGPTRERPYHGVAPFALHLLRVLEAKFPDGSERYEQDGVIFARTTARVLVAGTRRVKVSLKVSYPHTVAGTKMFKVAYQAYERPAKDTWGDLETTEGREALGKFLDEVVAALAGL